MAAPSVAAQEEIRWRVCHKLLRSWRAVETHYARNELIAIVGQADIIKKGVSARRKRERDLKKMDPTTVKEEAVTVDGGGDDQLWQSDCHDVSRNADISEHIWWAHADHRSSCPSTWQQWQPTTRSWKGETVGFAIADVDQGFFSLTVRLCSKRQQFLGQNFTRPTTTVCHVSVSMCGPVEDSTAVASQAWAAAPPHQVRSTRAVSPQEPTDNPMSMLQQMSKWAAQDQDTGAWKRSLPVVTVKEQFLQCGHFFCPE